MKTISKILLGFCLLGMAVFAQAQNVVVVSSKSAVASLTKEQIADIYLGNSKEFPGGGQALPLLPASGGARSEFFDKVLGKNEAQAKAIWSRLVFSGKGSAPRDVADSAETVKLISSNPNCIGVIEKSAVNASVKVVFSP
jgi:ABC-type phosphate transport system substrate-binding protein